MEEEVHQPVLTVGFEYDMVILDLGEMDRRVMAAYLAYNSLIFLL